MANQTAWVIHHGEPSPSYNSTTMLAAFAAKQVQARLIDFNMLSLVEDSLILGQEVLSPPDFAVFVNQTHTVLGSSFLKERNDILDKLDSFENITFANSPLAHAAAANKITVYKKLIDAGISLPKTEFVNADAESSILQLMLDRIGQFPVVVKYPFGFESMAVRICYEIDELKAAIEQLKTEASIKVNTVILQEYVSAAEAAMFCVRVVGDQIFTRMFLGSPYGVSSFKSIVSYGRQQMPCKTVDSIKQIATAVTSTLNLDAARIDMFLTGDGIKVCDVNSIGSFLPTDQTHNIKVGELITDLLIRKKQEG